MKNVVVVSLIGATVLLASQAFAHCQIPCGIYNDEMRLTMIGENIATIEKAIRQVEQLSEQDRADYNQIVRWTNVKDQHADDIAEIVSWYFLQQRIKPVGKENAQAHDEYVEKLMLLHEMLIYSMKAKQSMDIANVDRLKVLLHDFGDAYAGK